MNTETARAIIETKIESGWSDSTVPRFYENTIADPPDEGHWVRVSVQPLERNPLGLNECDEIIGQVGVQIFSPLRTGTKKQQQIVDDVISILHGNDSGVSFREARISTPGEQDGWYQCIVLVGYSATGLYPLPT